MLNVNKPRQNGKSFALFELGFRPFFLLAGSFAIVGVSGLVAALSFQLEGSCNLSPTEWHGHEMLYGFVVAAIAGFLLTAVPNWTQSRAVSGPPLMLLVLIWLAGRVALSPWGACDASVSAFVDLAFIPALIAALVPALGRFENPRNSAFLVLLTLLFFGNLLFHNSHHRWFEAGSIDGLRLAVNTVTLVVVIVAGRIVPLFTRNALLRDGVANTIVASPILDGFAIAAVVLMLAFDVIAPLGTVAIVICGVAAVLHLVRLSRWQGWKAAHAPIVWVLHVGYAWLVVAFALKALWLGLKLPLAAYWMHALTAGAFGTMVLGVMSRVALGHTGRPLVVKRAVAAAFVMVSIGTLLRVFGVALLPAYFSVWVATAGAIWIVAFVVFVFVYSPILVGARVTEAAVIAQKSD